MATNIPLYHEGMTRIRRRVLQFMLLFAAYVLGAATIAQLALVTPANSTARLYDPPPVRVRVQTTEDAERVRTALWTFIFGDAPPSAVMQNGFASTPEIRTLDRANGQLIIYHTGHAGEQDSDTRAINAYLNAGYAVAVFDMPFLGRNKPVWVDLPRLGQTLITSHDQMPFLAPITDGSPIRYFIEPVITFLDRIEGQYERIIMTGVSGGGWTTTLVAALDTRIDASYPVAGNLPMTLVFTRADAFGDWEQHLPDLYAIAGYEDLYVLGAQGREQVQFFNQYDPCCFAGDHRQFYEAQVAAAVHQVGGRFEIYLDTENREHSLSASAQRWLLDHLT
jgi:dienelactone hydrolase